MQSKTSETINEVLRRVGSAAQVDRVYIFELTRTEVADATFVTYASHAYEWSSDAVEPQIDNPDLQMIPLREAGYGRWLDELERYRPIVGSVANFPREERPTLTEQGILTLLILPIRVGSRLWGFVGFDDCTSGRQWTTGDVDTLIALSIALGNALGGQMVDSVGATIGLYLQIVGRLLQGHSVLFDDSRAMRLQERAEVRLRVVSRSYQYFAGIAVEERIDLGAYLSALEPLFRDIVRRATSAPATEVTVDADVVPLALAHGVDVAIVLGEALAATVDRAYPNLRDASFFISAHCRETVVEVTVTARAADGSPIGKGDVLDGPAAALLRDVRERFDVKVSGDTIDGLLVRLSFPFTD